MVGELGIVYHQDYLLHTNDHHPECRERLISIRNRLKKEGLLSQLPELTPDPTDPETVALVHEREYIDSIKEACRRGVRSLDLDTYLCPNTYEVALLSVGGALAAVEAVMEGKLKKVFALIRPPGHHAEADRGMGFCIFNNVAVAAEVTRRKYKKERILIIDWDVHHGNGTQDIFYQDDGVLYFSIHQSPAFPGTGRIKEIGSGKGKGFTINMPLPAGCGDDDYLRVFEDLLVPVANQFQPEMIFVSAGQDAYHRDPLAGMLLTTDGYARMTRIVDELARRYCDGKVVFVLEGGYHLEGLSSIVLQILSVLGDWNIKVEDELLHRAGLEEVVQERINQAREALRPVWSI